ncbi:MAG TPA: hypothetical protein VGY13_06555 [Solirubrobacteraceae bacterium]|jgi:hypothetical protein|nr:hypothetical protein [Solirubrobacteraceae bacterium]
MGALEAILAVIGLVALIALVVGWYVGPERRPPADDAAAPYVEGLHAAMRMHTVGQELEQQLYAEAMRRADQAPDGQ